MIGDYAEEKFWQALDCLVTGMGRLQQRLAAAAVYIIRLQQRDFPDRDSWKIAEGIHDDLTYMDPQPGDDGSIEATTKRLSDEDARQIAKRIFDLYIKLRDYNRDRDRDHS